MKYTVIYDNTPCCAFAASELVSFTQRATGVLMPALPCGGETPVGKTVRIGTRLQKDAAEYGKLNADGFFLSLESGNVIIDADTDRGCLYGVYELLERTFGIRFLAPDTTVIPKKRLNFGEDFFETHAPLFRLRCYLDGSVYADLADADFVARCRARHGYFVPDERHGGGRAMYGRNTDHNFHFYVPREVYGARHPEWYADHPEFGETVCLSNGLTEDGRLDRAMDESVLKVAIEEMKKDILKYPDIDYFVFEQEDGGFYCECEKCRENEIKYMRSGMLIRFCNVMAGELQAWADACLGGRKINIVTFAYSYGRMPPVKKCGSRYIPLHPTVVARGNVVMRLALFANAAHHYFHKKQSDDIKYCLAAWKTCAANFMFWAYDTAYDRYMPYYPSLKNLKPNITGWRDMGISFLLYQAVHNTNFNWQSLQKGYICNKLMWNPALSVKKLAAEFIRGYFGRAAAPYIQKMQNLYEDFYKKLIAEKSGLVFMTHGNFRDPENMPLGIIDSALALTEQAEAAVKKGGNGELRAKYLKHIAAVRTTPLFSKVVHYKYYYPEHTEKQRKAAVKEFCAVAEASGQTRYHEQLTIKSLIEADYTFPY